MIKFFLTASPAKAINSEAIKSITSRGTRIAGIDNYAFSVEIRVDGATFTVKSLPTQEAANLFIAALAVLLAQVSHVDNIVTVDDVDKIVDGWSAGVIGSGPVRSYQQVG
jgi:hypothetical protein